MKIYQVFCEDDPASSDCFYPTRAEANKAVKYFKEDGRHPTLVVHEFTGRLNRDSICKMLTTWPQR